MELTLVETGALPDGNGYVVNLTPMSWTTPLERIFVPLELDPQEERYAHPRLPAGAYTLRVEDLTEHCAVTGGHPISFTIRAGETTRLGVEIFCTDPGALQAAISNAPTISATASRNAS